MAETLLGFPNQYDQNILDRMVERFSVRASALAYQQYFTMRSTNLYQYKNDTTSGFGALDTVGDGEAIPMDSPINMGTYTLVQTRYARGFKVGPMIKKFGDGSQVQGWADALIDSAVATLRTKHAGILNNGFSASYAYRESGVALFSASHTSAGGTRTNLASAAALTFSTYDTLRQLAGAQVDYRGKLNPMAMDILVVPDELAVVGAQIVGSPQQPFTTDNQINPFVGRRLVVDPYLTSATAYFGVDSSKETLISLTSQAITPREFYQPETESNVVCVSMIFAVGVKDWPGLVASAGA